MGVHAEFIYRLVNLVEYAELHELEVASLALNAAVEMIAPSIALGIYSTTNKVQPSMRPALRVINGGRAMAEAS